MSSAHFQASSIKIHSLRAWKYFAVSIAGSKSETEQGPELSNVPLVEFMYLVFTRMPGESYRRRLRSLLLYLRRMRAVE